MIGDSSSNFLDYIPVIDVGVNYSVTSDNLVVITKVNNGFINRMMQKFFHKPKKSYINLDNIGSNIFLLIDGKKNIYDITNKVISIFGNEKVDYERTCRYINMLLKCNFIKIKKP